MFTIHGNNIPAAIISKTYEKAVSCVNAIPLPIIKLKQCVADYFYQPQTLFRTNEYLPPNRSSVRASMMCHNAHTELLSDLVHNGLKNYSVEVEDIFKANLEHLPLNLYLFIQSFYDFCDIFSSVKGLITEEEINVIKSLQDYTIQSFSNCEQENTTKDLAELHEFKNSLIDFNESVDKWLGIFLNIKMETPINAILRVTEALKHVKKRLIPLLHSIDTTSEYCFEYLPHLGVKNIIPIIDELNEIYEQLDDSSETSSSIKAELENAIPVFELVFKNPQSSELNAFYNTGVFCSKVKSLIDKLDDMNDEKDSEYIDLLKLKEETYLFFHQYNLLCDQTLKIDIKINQDQVKETIRNLQLSRDLYANSMIDLSNNISNPKEILANLELTKRHLNKAQLKKVERINRSLDVLINKTEYESFSFEPLLSLLNDFQNHYKDKEDDEDLYKLELINTAVKLAIALNKKEEIDAEFNLMMSQLYLTLKTVLLKSKEAISNEKKITDDTSENSTSTTKIHTELKSICKTFESVYLKGRKKSRDVLTETISKGASSALEQLDFLRNATILETLSFINAIQSDGELKFTPKPVAFSIKTLTLDEIDNFFEHVVYKFDRVNNILHKINTESDIETSIFTREVIGDFQRVFTIFSNIGSREIEQLEENEKIAIEQRLETFNQLVSSIKNEEIKQQLFTIQYTI